MLISSRRVSDMFNFTLLRNGRLLCDGSLRHNPEYVRGVAELIIDMTPGASQDVWKESLMAYLDGQPVPDHNPNGPMTQEQRGALFAAFGEVFGHSDAVTRHAFTGMVLGRNDRCSWAGNGGITYGEASKVLDALDVLNV